MASSNPTTRQSRKARAPANIGPVARSPILHHVSTVVLALGGVLTCLEGGNALAFRLPPGVVPVPSANWSTDPGASLTNNNTATGVSQIIKQQANAAVYTWNSFNIANGSSVYFNMAQGSGARALNRLMGGSIDPMIIEGSLGSNGQVYLINQNGILFGAGAQVNVGGLVASALNMDTNDFLSGLQSISSPTPTFFYDGDPTKIGSATVTVENGANLSSPGGRVFLFGTQVSNAGHISAAGGQVGLAAGTEVYLSVPSVASLRGLLIDVTKAGTAVPAPGTMSVTNTETGVIETDRGNTTLAAYFVNQMGRISATTSATANGSIYLQARDSVNAQVTDSGSTNIAPSTLVKVAGRGGELVLGSNSVTEVLPENDGTTTDNTKTFYASSVALTGKLIDMKSGASIVATGGQVTATALSTFDPINNFTTVTTIDPATGKEVKTATLNWSDLILNGNAPVAQDGARFVMESGASIDVSGAQGVQIAMERNNVTTALLGANDLKDAPLQRDGILYRNKITFDVRDGVPILGIAPNSGAYEDAIQRGAAEKLSAGGTIKLMSSGDMALAKDSRLDISGGSLAYQGGYINSTRLTSNGKVYDISSAPANLVYDGIFGTYTVTSPKFGPEATQSWSLPTRGTYEAGYVEGKSAGTISIASRSLSNDATIRSRVTVGPLQRDPASLPMGGTLNIGLASDPAAAGAVGPDYLTPDIRIATQGQDLSNAFWADPAHAAGSGGNQVVLDANMLSNSGIGTLNLYSNGSVVQDAGANLKLAPGGGMTVKASSVTLGADVQAKGGNISVTTQITKGHTAEGDIVVAGNLDTSGGWVNDSALLTGSTPPTSPVLINGGSISLEGNGINILSQAKLDVSGGAQLTASGKLNLGNGGRIVLASAGTRIASDGTVTQANGSSGWLNGALQLDGQLVGAGPGSGGSLALGLLAPVRIGGTAAAGEVGLDTGFFGRGGFDDYTIASVNGLTLSAGTQLAPRAQTMNLTGNYQSAPTGSALGSFATLGPRIDGKPAPVNLSLQAVGATQGRLTIENGASINSDTGATVTLVAGRQLTVDGSISAPAGAINLILRPGDNDTSASAGLLDRSIWLGSQSVLSAAGAYVPAFPGNGLRSGDVLAGGKINIDLQGGGSLATGMLVAQEGSVLDVRGASATLDLPAAGGTQPTLVGSNGGSISLKTFDGGLLDATMLASGGTPSAAGGQFSASIYGRNLAPPGSGAHIPGGQQSVVLSDGSSSLVPAGAQPGGVIDRSVYGGQLRLRTDRINQAGFNDITLGGENSIRTDGSVTLKAPGSINLNTPDIDVAPGATFNVNAPYVNITNLNVATGAGDGLAAPAPTGGAPGNPGGSLVVNAALIDLQGNVALTDVDNTSLNSSGDVRFKLAEGGTAGSFNTDGNLTITAGQAYATTGFAGNTDSTDPLKWNFNLNAPGHKITFASNGAKDPAIPLSAGGSLLVTARDIEQDGVLRAPLGRISLLADNNLTMGANSETSVSAGDLVIPYGNTINGQSWVYQNLTTADGSLSAPSKSLSLNGASVKLADGSVVDVSGGGNLYGYEFIPGVGGSTDVLANSNAYAIVPSLGKSYAPYDPAYAASSRTGYDSAPGASNSGLPALNLKVGDTITLGAGSGLPPGTYTLLPARYALLPGAYLVKPQSGLQDMRMGSSVAQADGSAIVAGYRGSLNNGAHDARTSGWLVESGTIVRTQSQYNDSYGNTFFSSLATSQSVAAPRSSADAGIVAINAGQDLALDGTLKMQGAVIGKDQAGNDTRARGAALDIASANGNIAVTDNGPGVNDKYTTGPDHYLVLNAAKLNAIGAESLMLGGSRSSTGVVTTTSSKVVVDSASTALAGQDVILTGKNNVTVAAGSSIQTANLANADTLQVSGAGALVRVAGNDNAAVTRTGVVPGTGATLTVGANAQVGAAAPGGTATVVLDSSDQTTIASSATVRASTALVSAGSMSAGDVPAGSPGLALESGLLDQLGQAHNLTLRSYSSIDFYGNATLGSAALDNLTLDAYALAGRGPAAVANISAGQVTLANTTGNSSNLSIGGQPLGSGTLNIAATNNLILGTGAKTLQGFGTVNLSAGKEFSLQNNGAQGTATLAVSGSAPTQAAALNITAGRISGASGADQAISATGQLTLQNNAASGTLGAPTGLGAKLALSGQSINDAGTIDLPSGNLSLSATGTGAADNVVIGSGAVLRATGSAKTFDGLDVYADAGKISLQSNGGNVQINSGALVDVSGAAGGGNAGSLNATALNGTVQVAGGAALLGNAAAGARSGTASIEAQTLNQAGQLDGINAVLNNGGFAEERDFRAHAGDLMVGSAASAAVNARNVSLEADGGAVNIAGSVGGAYAKAGEVRVTSANGVALTGSGQLLAKATGVGAAGGTVYVATTSSANNNLSIGGGGVDVSGGAGGTGGTLWLRAPQDNQMGAVAAITGQVVGASTTVLEGYKTYSYTGNVSVVGTGASNPATNTLSLGNSTTAGTILGDAKTFMNNAAAIAARVGNGQVATQVRAGAEVDAHADVNGNGGDINVTSALNFFPASGTAARPELNGGVLTLRAGRNLNISAGISDGFVATSNPAAVATAANATMQVGPNNAPTWSYHLVGGADLTAADTRRTVNDAGAAVGDVVIGKGTGTSATDVVVRTATGNIEIEAGRNVQLLNSQAVVYTTGASTSLDQSTQFFNSIAANQLGPSTATASNPFTKGGGAVLVEAKNDVIGPPDDKQVVDTWLFHRQLKSADNPQTAWWPRYDLFRQGIATFGGGDVKVSAGHDIKDFSASVVTSARLPADASGKQQSLIVNGGGDLTVQAGNNIAGGGYFEARGNANLSAGGSLTRGTQNYFPMLALQEGIFNVSAAGDVQISALYNPTIAPTTALNASIGTASNGAFSSYSDSSAVNLKSLNGNVEVDPVDDTFVSFVKQKTGVSVGNAGLGLSSGVRQNFNVSPATVNAVAFSGDVTATVNMMPSSTGNLNLLAADNVNFRAIMMDRPLSGTDSLASITNGDGLAPGVADDTRPLDTHGYSTTHANDDTQARIVALTGDVTSTNPSFISKSTDVIAGRDIVNLALTVENARPDGVTLASAGRDFTYASLKPESQAWQFAVDGPGQMIVKAGRNVDLGISGGLLTRGNTANRFLDGAGASITVLAGVSGSPDYAAISARYLDGYGAYAAAYLQLGGGAIDSYLAEITAFVRQTPVNANLTQWAALNLFLGMPATSQAQLLDSLAAKDRFTATLPAFRQFLANYDASPVAVTSTAISQFQAETPAQQQPFLQRLLFAELGNASSAASQASSTAAKDAAYQRGTDAIAAMFPGSTYKGDLLMFSSQIKTEAGGDISIFVPGGMVNAGQVVSTSGKKPSDLGIITVAGGSIGAVVHDDFLVNQSRVFTLAGGGILMWSTDGNLDAGRGAKTATSAPAPVLRIDSNGNLIVDFSGAVSGSGIGTIITDKSIAPGDVILAAPKGSINTGDAGIQSAGNFVAAAPILHGADNLQVGGASSGVPAQGGQSAPPPPPAISDDTRKVVDQISQAIASNAGAGGAPVTNNVFIGFGE